MTAKRITKKSVNRDRWQAYLNVAEQNVLGAEINIERELWTPAGILIVHAAIAFTDALTIKAGSVKSTGETHTLAVELVDQLLELPKDEKRTLNRLARILGEKSKVAYGGRSYSRSQINGMWHNLKRYRDWVKVRLDLLQ